MERSTATSRPEQRSRRPIITTAILALALLVGACTSSSDAGSTTTTTEGTPTTIDALADLVDRCRVELLEAEPDMTRLALDPAIVGYALNLPADAVPEAAEELFDCFGPDNAATYLATDLIIAGQPLPPSTRECFATRMDTDGVVMLEMSLYWARIEVPPEDVGETFIDVMLECVPGRFLAAPIRGENPAGYEIAVDTDCLDEAQRVDPGPMQAFWDLQAFSGGSPDPSKWTDAEAADNVAPLYACVDTGTLIATDQTIGATLSGPTRVCLSEVAADAGYWESRVALRPFDEEAYGEALTECLTPEEAQQALGIPIELDDPEESNFGAVPDCYQGDEESLDDEVSALSDDPAALGALAEELATCAGAEGVAGRYASLVLGRRLPAGTYDCFLPLAEANPVRMLTGKLFDEAQAAPSSDASQAFTDAISACVAPSLYTRGVYSVLTSPAILDTITPECVDVGLADGTEANDAYWAAYRTVDHSSDADPTDEQLALAATGVAALYDCVSPGLGFADVAEQAGAELSETTIDCIDTSILAIQALELSLLQETLPEDSLNGAIADCLSEDEVEQIRGG